MKTGASRRKWAAGVTLFVGLLSCCDGDTFTDGLAGGMQHSYWITGSNSAAFSINPTSDAVQIQSATSPSTGFHWGALVSQLTAFGDFDVSVEFTNANLTW